MSIIHRIILCSILLTGTLAAQYRTESWDLVPGWNAIYLNIDPGEATLDTLLVGQPDITEVWEWVPAGLDAPLETGETTGVDEWRVWRRDDIANSTFSAFTPHRAYNIRTTTARTFSLKGEVLAPKVTWRTDGSNLLGFPIAGTSKKLSDYLAGSGIVDNNTEVFRYTGGDISSTNPAQVPARLVQAKRGEAFWIRSHRYSGFYAPVSVEIALDSGLHYGARGNTKRLVLRNQTNAEITVTLTPSASEAAPGETAVPVAPSLLIREIDETNGLFTQTPIGGGIARTIPAQGAVGMTLSVDRAGMGTNIDQFAGLLQITDASDLTEIYIPITAERTDLAGLWVGEAQITKVQNQLQRFQRDADGNYLVDDEGAYVPENLLDGAGNPVLDGQGNPIPFTDQELNATAQMFKLRLIVHVDAAGTATLLSHVYAGVISDDGAGNALSGIATAESFLHADHLDEAVRLSASHFPTDLVQPMGDLTLGGALTATITLVANHPSNPFLHTYHPDHDNKDARFENTLDPGIESHTVARAITLTFNASASPGEGPQWGSTLLSGAYAETITGIHKQTIATSGIFALGKVSDIAVLQTQ